MEALGSESLGELRAPRTSTLTPAGLIAKIGIAAVIVPGAAGLVALALGQVFPHNHFLEAMAWGTFMAIIALVTVLPCCLILAALVRKFSHG